MPIPLSPSPEEGQRMLSGGFAYQPFWIVPPQQPQPQQQLIRRSPRGIEDVYGTRQQYGVLSWEKELPSVIYGAPIEAPRYRMWRDSPGYSPYQAEVEKRFLGHEAWIQSTPQGRLSKAIGATEYLGLYIAPMAKGYFASGLISSGISEGYSRFTRGVDISFDEATRSFAFGAASAFGATQVMKPLSPLIAKGGQYLSSKVAERIPEVWKLSFEEYVKEPVGFYTEYLRFATEPARESFAFYKEYLRFTIKENVYDIPGIGPRLGGERFTKLLGTREFEETFQQGELFGKRGILELQTKDIWVKPSEARLIEAEQLLTRPTKIIGVGTEWTYVSMPSEGFFSFTPAKQVEVEYSTSLLDLIGTKGNREVYSVFGSTGQPIEGSASRFIYRDITGIEILGKPLKGYSEVFGFKDVFTAPSRAIPWREQVANAPKMWFEPLTGRESATNQILREIGMALPTEKAFSSMAFRKATAMGIPLGLTTSQLFGATTTISRVFRKTSVAQVTTRNIEQVFPSLPFVKTTQQIRTKTVFQPPTFKGPRERGLPNVFKGILPTYAERTGKSLLPTFAPILKEKTAERQWQGVPQIPRLTEGLTQRQTQKQSQRQMQKQLQGIMSASGFPTSTKLTNVFPLWPTGGGESAERGGGGSLFGKWYKKQQAIKTPRQMMETFFGSRQRRRRK